MVDDRLVRTVDRALAALGGLGVVVVVVVLLAGAAGTLYGAAHLVAWGATWLAEGRLPVPAPALLVGGISGYVTWLCFRVIRRLGDTEDGG